jgi:dUTPase
LNKDFKISNWDKVCQIIISKHEKSDRIDVEILEKTDIGSGGFRHKGKK